MARPKKTKPASDGQSTIVSISDWINQQNNQDLLRFITCGSVDDGKSTLIGRLLWETKQIYDDQISALQNDSLKHGTQGSDIDYALLVDGLSAEREQGITIDVAYRFFSSTRRKFIVADTPGHEQYTRNMITGASTATLAVILVDARKGLLEQTRRHSYIASLMGIKKIIVAINKMDLVDYNKVAFDAIRSDFLDMTKSFGFEKIVAIPLSALKGDNITARSTNMKWYAGPTFISCLETIDTKNNNNLSTAFLVQWVNRPNSEFRGFSGSLISGSLGKNDKISVTSSGQSASIERIVTMDGDIERAENNTAITLVLDKEIDASRGDIISLSNQPLEMTDQFEAMLVWLHSETGHTGRSYEIKLANQWASASITSLKYQVDVNSQNHKPCRKLELNDIAAVNLALSRPLVFSPYAQSEDLGGFILVDKFNHMTVACGMIRHSLIRAQHVHRQALSITRQNRELINGHRAKVIWFTGLSGSGKSTIANALEKELYARGKKTYIMDGDNMRQGLNKDLGFTDADRVENIRRVGEVAKLMVEAGLIVLTAFISPFEAERQMVRELIGDENFIEIFIDTPLEVCEMRDPKGLYKKARSGIIPNMTGISSPYETPTAPNLTIDTVINSIENIVETIIQHIDQQEKENSIFEENGM